MTLQRGGHHFLIFFFCLIGHCKSFLSLLLFLLQTWCCVGVLFVKQLTRLLLLLLRGVVLRMWVDRGVWEEGRGLGSELKYFGMVRSFGYFFIQLFWVFSIKWCTFCKSQIHSCVFAILHNLIFSWEEQTIWPCLWLSIEDRYLEGRCLVKVVCGGSRNLCTDWKVCQMCWVFWRKNWMCHPKMAHWNVVFYESLGFLF